MNKTEQHSKFQKWSRRLAWGFFAIIIFALAVRLSLKTAFVRDQVQNFIVSTANSRINGELEIADLSGDLWKDITVSGLTINQVDTLVQVDSIRISYNIWALLGGKVDVNKFEIYQPKMRLHRQENQWNILELLPESEDTSASGGMMAFQVEDLLLRGGQLRVKSDSLFVEPNFVVDKLNISSQLAYSDEAFNIDLRDFSFQVRETNLEAPIAFEAMASAQNEQFTLEQLVLATGRSVIEAKGYANAADSSVDFSLLTTPIAWRDVTEYYSDIPLHKDIDLNLNISGNPDQFNTSLAVAAEGLQSFRVNGQFVWRKGLVLQRVSANAKEANFATLFADTAMPNLKNMDAQFEGAISMADFRQAHGTLSFALDDLAMSSYQLDKLSGNLSLENQLATLKVEANRQQQSVILEALADDVWEDHPSVEAEITASGIDPAYWIQDSVYAGNLSFRAQFSGLGWYPQKEPWRYMFRMNKGQLMGHPISNLALEGEASNQEISVDGSLNIGEGSVKMAAALQNYFDQPSYNYSLTTENLDLGYLMGRPDFPTAVNSKITGEGTGINLENMQLQSSALVSSSTVNSEPIDSLSVRLAIGGGRAEIERGRLQSGIADGVFNLEINLLDFYNSNNELFLDLNLKDLRALGPLAGVDTLQAKGVITGRLNPSQNRGLRFLGTVGLGDVIYNELFVAEGIRGSVDVNLVEKLRYLIDLDLDNPSFSGIELQNLNLVTKGDYADGAAVGRFDFQFSSPNEGRIEQSGIYNLTEDSIRIRTEEINLISDYRTLTLEEPFELRFQNNVLQMDTMRVSSGDGAFLEVALPRFSKKEQYGFIRGQSLNTAVIQSSLLGKTYFRGMLSGDFEMIRRDTSLKARGGLLLTEVKMGEAGFDSLAITADIEEERLKGTLMLKDEGTRLIDGNVNLPFKLGNPEEFGESFFKESVAGEMRVRNISIERFQSYFDYVGIAETKGAFSFLGTLEGTAGNPEFDIDFTLKDAMLSGVAIDSITAGGNYRHVDEQLTFDASVISLNQQAAQIRARLPLFIDMKTFEVDLPEPEDTIAIDVETDDFNLRALNDFLDPLLLREVDGRLDGMVHINGPMNNLKTDGKLELNQGAFRLIPAGITVDNISTELKFEPNQITLAEFVAQSGGGNIRANGIVGLKKLVPGDLDIQLNAQNFRVANTDRYNAVINADAKAKGSVTNPRITGSLSFLSGFLKLDNFGEKSVEYVSLDQNQEEPSVSVYDSLALDMDVAFDRRFFIQNERYLEMEVELNGELDLSKKKGEAVQLFGTMNAASGYARPFGKQFDIEEGAVIFSGNSENPQLAIRTRYEPPQTEEDIIIWYVIEGTVEDPKFKYESRPQMELENIISYTIFGQPFYALDSWKQVVASSGSNTTAADIAFDILLDRVETLATQQLGIDVVRIDNTRSGGETGTSITTGWYLNPKVFFAIQNVITGSSPDTGFKLEYMLRKDLNLILRQGNNIRQGVDIKWNYDY